MNTPDQARQLRRRSYRPALNDMVSLSPLMMLALPVVLLPLKFRIELLVIVALPIVLVFRDYPNADPFMLHIYAAVAEQERTKISERTKAALAAAKNHPKG